MSRTKKDYKKNKKWDNRTHEFRSGVKKWWRRLSNKLGRQTPVVKNIPRKADKWELD